MLGHGTMATHTPNATHDEDSDDSDVKHTSDDDNSFHLSITVMICPEVKDAVVMAAVAAAAAAAAVTDPKGLGEAPAAAAVVISVMRLDTDAPDYRPTADTPDYGPTTLTHEFCCNPSCDFDKPRIECN